MFMRYFGGGVGHQSMQQHRLGAEEMDIDEVDTEAEEDCTLSEGNHLQSCGEDAGEEEDEDDDDEDEDPDDEGREDEDEDFGPEDGEDSHETDDYDYL
jgi:hypothetical protein